jgi:hypothetical protein
MNKHTSDIEGIVEEFEKEFWDHGDERYGWVKHNNTIVQRQIDWLRTTLQSQADQYEREKGEILKACFDVVNTVNNYDNPKTANDCADEIKTIAQKYGVDLSE